MRASEIDFKTLVNDADFAKYEVSEKNFFVSSLKQGKRPLRVILEGELTTEGINQKTFDTGINYSLGLKLEEQEDIDALLKLSELLCPHADDYEVKEPVQPDGQMYVKIPLTQNKDKFAVKCNLKLYVKKLEELDVYRSQGVKIECDLGAWYNTKDKKAGLFIKPRKITFEEEEPVPKKAKN